MSQSNRPDPRNPPPRQAGVYDSVSPRAEIQEADLYVPPFLGPEFLAFLLRFIAEPTANPVFQREWRRNIRRLGPLAGHWILVGVLGTVAMLVPAVGAIVAVRSVDNPTAQGAILAAILVLPVMLASVYAFFASLQGANGLMSRAALEEMTLAGLRPQEIVFGYLTGSLIPLSLPALLMLPGIALMGFDLGIREPLGGVGVLFALGMVVGFYPAILGAMLWSGSVAATVSYGENRAGVALFKAIGTWLLIGLVIHFPFLQLSVPAMISMGGALGVVVLAGPILVLIQIAVAAAFLHHLAVRMARLTAME